MKPASPRPGLTILLLLLAGAFLSAQTSQQTPRTPVGPGLGSWTQFRGDALGTGRSLSPEPRYVGVKWKYFTADSVTAGPMVVDGRIIAATETGQVHCVDVKTGKKIWARVVGPGGPGNGFVHGSPRIFNGKIYLGSRRGRFYCVRLADGEVLWSRELTHAKDRVTFPAPIYASPRGDERGIVVPTMEHAIYCLDPETGKTRWKVETAREIGSTPVILGNRIFAPSKGRRVYEIDYGTGKVLRKILLPGTTHCSPAFGLGYLFLTIGGNRAVAVDLAPPAAGQLEMSHIKWNIQSQGEARNAMAYADGIVYMPDLGDIIAVDANSGKRLWSYTTSYKPCDPCIVGDHLIFAVRDGFVKALDRRTGKEVWSIKLDYKIYQGPIVVDGVIYVATMDNYLIAIE